MIRCVELFREYHQEQGGKYHTEFTMEIVTKEEIKGPVVGLLRWCKVMSNSFWSDHLGFLISPYNWSDDESVCYQAKYHVTVIR